MPVPGSRTLAFGLHANMEMPIFSRFICYNYSRLMGKQPCLLERHKRKVILPTTTVCKLFPAAENSCTEMKCPCEMFLHRLGRCIKKSLR